MYCGKLLRKKAKDHPDSNHQIKQTDIPIIVAIPNTNELTYLKDSYQSLQSQTSVFVIIGIDNCRFYRCLLLEGAMLNESLFSRGNRGSP